MKCLYHDSDDDRRMLIVDTSDKGKCDEKMSKAFTMASRADMDITEDESILFLIIPNSRAPTITKDCRTFPL